MKSVILASGLGTQISGETNTRPNPRIAIDGKSSLREIPENHSPFAANDVKARRERKGHAIKKSSANLLLDTSDAAFATRSRSLDVLRRELAPWRSTPVTAGECVLTGNRLRRLREHIGGNPWDFAYGEGGERWTSAHESFHQSKGREATFTALLSAGLHGSLAFNRDQELSHGEKRQKDGSGIHGGFFVLEPATHPLINHDKTNRSFEPLRQLQTGDDLSNAKHRGIRWARDTLRVIPCLRIWDGTAWLPGSSGAEL